MKLQITHTIKDLPWHETRTKKSFIETDNLISLVKLGEECILTTYSKIKNTYHDYIVDEDELLRVRLKLVELRELENLKREKQELNRYKRDKYMPTCHLAYPTTSGGFY